jgi:hypothetical protein
MVGAIGFEPTTPSSRTRCATRLRYAPKIMIFINRRPYTYRGCAEQVSFCAGPAICTRYKSYKNHRVRQKMRYFSIKWRSGINFARQMLQDAPAPIMVRQLWQVLGRSQAVRQRILIPPCGGSNPPAPATYCNERIPIFEYEHQKSARMGGLVIGLKYFDPVLLER